MPTLGPELDVARARVVARGLTVKALGQLTPLVTGLGLSLEALGPVKQLQKRFFSDVTWTPEDDDALADAIGPGADDVARYELEPGLTLFWGWEGGRFRLRVASDEPAVPAADDDPTAMELGQLFEGPVVPEATPSPRTIRFATPPIHAGPGRAYGSTAAADADPRVARIFQAFDDVTDVLVGPDFVAVTISRPGRWESLLGPMLRASRRGVHGRRRRPTTRTRAPGHGLGPRRLRSGAGGGRPSGAPPRTRLGGPRSPSRRPT